MAAFISETFVLEGKTYVVTNETDAAHLTAIMQLTEAINRLVQKV